MAISETSQCYVILHVCVYICMSTHTHAHIRTTHTHIHFLGSLYSNHFLEEDGKSGFNFTELTRRDNEYFQNSLCMEALGANPRAFLLLATNYWKKEKFPQLWSTLMQTAQTQFHKVYCKGSIHIINEKMLHVFRPSVNWLNESMSKSDSNHTVAVQWSECVRGKGPLSSSHTPRYVDVSSLLLLLPKL